MLCFTQSWARRGLVLLAVFASSGFVNGEPRLPGKAPAEEDAVNDPLRLEYAATVYRAYTEFRNGNVYRAETLLNACRENLRGWEWHYIHRLCHPEVGTLPTQKADGSKWNYTSAEWSVDGNNLLTTQGDNTVTLWDATTFKVTKTLTAESHKFTHASLSRDGKKVVATGRALQGVVLEVSSGKTLFTLAREKRPVGDAAFSHDGKRIVTSGHRELTVWDAENGKELTTFPSVAFDHCRPSFSPDGSKIVADGFGSVGVWKAEQGTLIQRLTGGGNNTLNISRFSPDGKFLVVTSNDSLVRLYDADLKEALTYKGHASGQAAAAFSPDNTKVVTAGHDGTMRLWDTQTGSERRLWKTTGRASDVGFNADGNRLFTLEGGTVKIWDATAEAQPKLDVAEGSWLIGVAFSPDGKRVAAGNISNFGWKVDVRNLATRKTLFTLTNHDYVVHNVEFSPDGKLLLTRTGTGRTKIWDAESGKQLHDLNGTGKQQLNLIAHFTRDSAHVLTLREGKIHMHDVKSGEKVREFKAMQPLQDMWSSPDSKQVVGLTRENSLVTWNAATSDEVRTVALQDGPKTTEQAWFSPDGTRIVIAPRNEVAQCFSTKTGKRLYSLTGMNLRDDRQLEFSADSTRFTTILFGANTIHVFDAASGHELLAINAHTTGVSKVVISPHQTQLISTGDKGPLLLHDARPRVANPK